MVTLSKPKVVKEYPFAGARNRFFPSPSGDLEQTQDAVTQFVKFFFYLEPRRRQTLMGILNALNDVQESLEDHTHVKADITDLETITATPTADAIVKADGSGELADGWVKVSNVTQHEAALSIDGPQVDSGILPDARIQASGVTQHEAALSIAGPQVDSGILPDARIQVTGVTQHEVSIDRIAASFQIGTGGPRIRDNSGVVEFRNAADSALASTTAQDVASADFVDAANEYRVGSTKVVGAGVSGWGDPTGTATRTAFATSTVTTEQLAERVKALIDDLKGSHGLLTS